MNLPLILLVSAVFGHGFVLWLHGNRMWNAEHYSFFPLGIAAAIVIWNQRRAEIFGAATKASPYIAIPALALAVVSVILSTLLMSGFFGWISWVVFLLGFLFLFFGGTGALKSMPVLVMLLAITPLPAALDEKLILNMQYLASLLASTGLDVFGMIHVRQGVVLVSTTQSFLAEEACSGIRSLFSSIAGIVFWGIFQRYRIWRTVVNLVQGVFWVLVFNAARIMAVVMIEEWTDFSIATGWSHDLLGLVVFFVIAGTVLSTDALIRAFIPIPGADDEQAAVDDDQKEVLPSTAAAFHFPLQTQLNTRLVYILAGLFVLTGILGLRMFTLAPRVVAFAGGLPDMASTALPQELGEWQVTGFQSVKRGRGDLQGEKSFVWRLSSGEKEISFSVDGDWVDYHNLGVCYRSLGWQVGEKLDYSSLRQIASGVSADEKPQITSLDMSRLSGEKAIAFFSSLDRNGVIVLPRTNISNETGIYLRETLVSRLREVFGFGKGKLLRDTTFSPPVSTVQMVYYPKGPMDDATVDSLQKLYIELRKMLLRDKRFGGG